MNKFQIIGDKIILRDWELNDLNIYEKWLQPGLKWQEQDAPFFKYDIDKIKDNVSQKKSVIANNDSQFIRNDAVIALKNDSKFIGQVTSYWRSKETNWLRIGIIIYDDTEWGKGIGFESLKLWINYIFDTNIDLVRLGFTTWSGNIGMIKLAKRLGFQLEACHRKARILNGKYYDAIGYGILKEEWQEQINTSTKYNKFPEKTDFQEKIESEIKKEKSEIAKRLKEEGLDIQIIAKTTGLTKDQIEQL